MHNRFPILLFLICFALSAHGQTSYYVLPVKIPVSLAGNFGEMRGGHFHAGIDIRTEAREGLPLYAAAEGTVVRMACSASGYGRALYIDHPNGTTTVYAHMQRFIPALEKYLDEERYRRQDDQVDLPLPAGKFTVRRGELIGWSGNSGSSGGPHLHFEIRDTPSQAILNPASTGAIPVADNLPPTIRRLWYIQVDTLRGVPVSSPPREIKVQALAPGRYTVPEGEVKVARNGYFVLEAIDRMEGSANTLGIHYVRQSLDGEVTLEITRNRFPFSASRYVNALGHYALNRGTPYEMIRLAVMQANKAPFYSGVVNRGAVTLRDTLPHTLRVLIEDDNRNAAQVDLTVRRAALPEAPIPGKQLIAYPEHAFNHFENGTGITIPAGCLYEPVFYTQTVSDTASPPGCYSPYCRFHGEDTPLHSYVTLQIACSVPRALRPKCALARAAANGTLTYAADARWCAAGAALPERITARVRDFGTYCVVTDTLPPHIIAGIPPGNDLTGERTLVFSVKDDFSGVRSYRMRIDGQWALAEYDAKSATLTHPVDPVRFRLGGTHTVTLEATDNCGNRTLWEGRFVYRRKE